MLITPIMCVVMLFQTVPTSQPKYPSNTARVVMDLRAEVKSLQARIEKLAAENAELRERIKELEPPAGVDDIAVGMTLAEAKRVLIRWSGPVVTQENERWTVYEWTTQIDWKKHTRIALVENGKIASIERTVYAVPRPRQSNTSPGREWKPG